MRSLLAGLTVCLLAGCAVSPPKPPMPTGEYRPINAPTTVAKRDAIDFAYEGDIVGALSALQKSAPQITELPPVGKPVPLLVKVSLRSATLENVLRAIGEQGGGVAEVVLSTTRQDGMSHVYVRYHGISESSSIN